ncbi:hypothetical protein LTR95_007909 [Oleoguttula sp. CCFEE 5521]
MGNSPSRIETGMVESPFARLPAELRNEIWEVIFAGVWDDITLKIFRNPCYDILAPYSGGHPRLALLQTCQQVRRAASDFAWTNVRAVLDCDDPALDCPDIKEWALMSSLDHVPKLRWWQGWFVPSDPPHLVPCPQISKIEILEVNNPHVRFPAHLNAMVMYGLKTEGHFEGKAVLTVSDITMAITHLQLVQLQAFTQSITGIPGAPVPDSVWDVGYSFKALLKRMHLLVLLDMDGQKSSYGRFRYEKQGLHEP